MFKFFKKKAKQETKQEVYLVRFYHRYRPKTGQQFVEGLELKAFASEQEAISFVEGKRLDFVRDIFGNRSWVRTVKVNMEGYQAFIDKLEIK